MKVMLTKNQYPTLGLMNCTIGIVYEIVLDHYAPRKDTLFIPPLYVLVDLDSFFNDQKSCLNDIMIGGLPKNVVCAIPIFKSLDYMHEIKCPQYSKKSSIKKRQIMLTCDSCLTNYKGQGETFSNI
jgi:hypothetical protein